MFLLKYYATFLFFMLIGMCEKSVIAAMSWRNFITPSLKQQFHRVIELQQ